jgi:hypothetical protein
MDKDKIIKHLNHIRQILGRELEIKDIVRDLETI